ncbi:cytochrome c oxidase subunit I [Terriglobus aquaticus]|uniref:Cbb3-type cytochrome c oxidase subunit I n=1 Tax=Terriglobus aquaticus TaxID=940139 RepID=A0ABW9KJS3_9BACT
MNRETQSAATASTLSDARHLVGTVVRPRWREHQRIGLGYLGIALFALGIGAFLSLLMRVHRVLPALSLPFLGVSRPEDYLAWVTMHGTLMVFFVLTVAPLSGFANLVLPEQLGSRTMALPLVNKVALWLTALALLVLLAAFFVPGGIPIGGWSAYPPLSVLPDAGPGQATGMDLWLLSLAIFCIASTLGAVNLVVTVIRCRCAGMTYERMPLTVWSWLVTSLLTVLAFSVLLAALVMLFCDRHLGTAFFVPSLTWVSGAVQQRVGGGSPLLWLHLFWFFGHPEVYIAILPGMGLVTMLLGTFARRRIIGYRLMIGTTWLIGVLGLLVWGHHMFVAGLNPFAGTAFEVSTMAIALPSTAKVLNWLVILWRSRPKMQTPMLWALGFVSIFVTGGLTGPILAQPALDSYLHNTFFVVGHFHLIMAMAALFGIFAGVAYWFPLMTGRMLSERLGRWHFWWTVFFAYNTFFPMLLTGLSGEPRHYAQLDGLAGVAGALVRSTLPLERHITASAILLATRTVAVGRQRDPELEARSAGDTELMVVDDHGMGASGHRSDLPSGAVRVRSTVAAGRSSRRFR